MKRDFKRLFSLMLVAALIVAAFVCGAVNVAAEGEPFVVGGQGYATWKEAYDAATAGDKTIALGTDFSWAGSGIISLPSGYTLDLAGHTLTLDGFLAENAQLIDSTNGAGKVICGKTALTLNTANTYLPVWVNDGYVLVQPNVSSNYQKFVAQTDGSYYFAFRPGFGKINGTDSFANTYLKNNAEHGLQMRFYVLTGNGYTNDDAEMNSKLFYFADSDFAKVYGENKMFYAKMLHGESVDQLRVKTVIRSADTGVEYTSASMSGKAAMADFNRADINGDIPKNSYVDSMLVRFEGLSMENHVLHHDASGAIDGYYNEVLGTDPICFEFKYSDFTYTTDVPARPTNYYISFRFGTTEFIKLCANGAIVVDGTTVGNAGDLLKVVVDPVAKTVSTYNATTGNVYANKTLSVTITNNQIRIFAMANFDVKLSDFKIYTDANVSFADVLQDEKTEKTVTWTWDDGENADKLRPAMIKVAAYNGATKVNEAEVNAAAGTYTFGNLPKYDANGNEIAYTFDAVVEHYAVEVNDNALNLMHIPFTINYYYNNDFSNGSVTDPSGNTISVTAGYNEITDGYLIVRGKADGISRLFYTGASATTARVIRFKVRLENADTVVPGSSSYPVGLRASTSNNQLLKIYGTKIYVGSHNCTLSADKWVEVMIHADFPGSTLYYKLTDTQGNVTNGQTAFSGTVNRLELYALTAGAFGLCIDDLQISDPAETVDVTGNITWDDGDNQDGKRPENVTVNLYNGSVLVDSAVVTEGAFSFADLPKTNATTGADYVYTVNVVTPDGYTKTRNGNNFTLSHTPTTEDVEVTWTWDDSNDNDKIRPANITIGLYVGGVKKYEESVSANAGQYTFENIDIADYELRVNAVEGYEINVNGYAATLTHEATITWYFWHDFNGELNQTLKPGSYDSIYDYTGTRRITALNGAYTQEGESGNQFLRYNYESLTGRVFYAQDYSSADQVVDISFKIRLVSGEFPTQKTHSGRTVLRINTAGNYSADEIPLYFEGTKMYVNGDTSVELNGTGWHTVSLHIDAANDKLIAVFDGETYAFDKTLATIGRLELVVSGAATVSFDLDDLAISKGVAKTSVSGTVAWDHGDNDAQPESVTVNLLQNGVKVASQEVTAATGWQYTFADLLVYDENSAAYTYTVTVDAVDGYEAVVNGTDITVTYVPTDMDVPVTWTWDDGEDNDEIRPANVTIGLYVGGVKKYEETVSANAGAYTFENIDIADYELRVTAIEGYEIAVDGYAITLTHEPTITWFYNNDFSNGSVTDNNSNTLSVVAGYNEITDGYLILRGNASNGQRLFYTGPKDTTVLDIRFKVRLENETTVIPGTKKGDSVYFRTNKGDNSIDIPFWFYGQELYVSGCTTTLSATEWTEVYIQIDFDGDRATYQIGDKSGSFDYTGAFTRLELYAVTAGEFGLCFDDMKLSKGVVQIPEEEPTEAPTEAPSEEPTEAPTEPEQDENAVSVSLENAFGGADSIVTLTFDDAGMNNPDATLTAQFVNELLKPHNLRASIMAVTNYKNYFNSWDNRVLWRDLLADGRLDVQSHSATHMVFSDEEGYQSNNTAANYQAEIVDSKTAIEGWAENNDVLAFAAAGNSMSAEGWEVVKANYYAARLGARGIQSLDPAMGTEAGGWHNLYMRRLNDGGSNSDAATMTGYVDSAIAQNGWLITLCHTVSDSGDATEAAMQQLIAYIGQKAQANEVWCASFSDAVKYIRERQNSTVVAVKDGETIVVTVTMAATTADGKSLPANVFNYPLTAKVQVPAEWTQITYTIGGKQEVVKTFTEDDATWAYVNILPNTAATVAAATEATVADHDVTLVWDDALDMDGIRPATLDVQAYKGQTLVGTATASAANGWVATVQLPKYDALLTEIAYTYVVTAPAGYTAAVNGNVITLSHANVTSYSFSSDLQNVSAPTELGLETFLEDAYAKALKLTTGAFALQTEDTNRYLAVSGSEDTYTSLMYFQNFNVSEEANLAIRFKVRLPDDQTTIPGNGRYGVVLRTNSSTDNPLARFYGSTLKIGSTTFTLSTDWKDVTILLNGTNGIYKVGDEIGYFTYSSDVNRLQMYAISKGAFTMHLDDISVGANIPMPAIDVPVTWTWDDSNDNDEIRPANITIGLYLGDVKKYEQTVAANAGEYTFENVDFVDYVVKVAAVDGYDITVDGHAVTLTHEPTIMDVPVTWTWDDSNDNDEIRPANITIGLYVGGVKKYEESVSANAGQYTFENIDIADYELRVTAIDGYEINVNGYAATLAHTPTINWIYSNSFNTAPVITLGASYDKVYDGKVSSTLSNGHDISVATGNATYVTEEGNGFIRITHENESGRLMYFSNYSSANNVVDIRFRVRLNSGTLPGGDVRANSVIFRLLNNSDASYVPFWFIGNNLLVKERSGGIDLTNGWVDVYVHLDGSTGVGMYEVGGTTGTFTHAAISRLELVANTAGTFELDFDDLKVSVGVSKTNVNGSVAFEDADNADGIRPSAVTVNLLQNGITIDSAVVNAENNWTYSFNDLLRLDANDAAYTYTVEAAPVEGYTASVDDGVITLTHVPTIMDVPVTWTWDDSNDNDKIRPANITIGLYVGGVKKYEESVSANAGQYTFENIDIADYELRVTAIEGYEIAVDGYAVTLTHVPAITWYFNSDFSVNDDGTDGKVYDAAENYIQVGAGYNKVEHGYLTLRGKADAASQVFYTGPKSSTILDIRFKVRLESETTDIPGTKVGNSLIFRTAKSTNSTDIPFWFFDQKLYTLGSKNFTLSATEWTDVYIHLDFANDTGAACVNGTTYTFSYTGEYSRLEMFAVTAGEFGLCFDDLQLYQDQGTAAAQIVWDDGYDADDIRPASVDVNLYSGETLLGSGTANAANNWQVSFAGNFKYDSTGAAIAYTAEVQNVPEGYTAEVGADGSITLSHTPVNIVYYDSDFEGITELAGDGNKFIYDAAGRYIQDTSDGQYFGTENGNTYMTANCLSDGGASQMIVWTNANDINADIMKITMRVRIDEDASFTMGDDITFRYRIPGGSRNDAFAEINGQTIDFTYSSAGEPSPKITQWTDVEFILCASEGLGIYKIGDAQGTFTFPVLEDGIAALMIRCGDNDGPLYYDDLKVFTPPADSVKIPVTASVWWEDSNNYDGIRSESVTLSLGGQTAVVTAADNWAHTFFVPAFDANGNFITNYTPSAIAPEGYTATANGTEVVLTHKAALPNTNKPGATVDAYFYNDFELYGVDANGNKVTEQSNDFYTGASVSAAEEMVKTVTSGDNSYMFVDMVSGTGTVNYQANFTNYTGGDFTVHYKLSTTTEYAPGGTYFQYRYASNSWTDLVKISNADGFVNQGSFLYDGNNTYTGSDRQIKAGQWVSVHLVFDMSDDGLSDRYMLYINGTKVATTDLADRDPSFVTSYVRLYFPGVNNKGYNIMVDDFIVYPGTDILTADDVNSPGYDFWVQPHSVEDVAASSKWSKANASIDQSVLRDAMDTTPAYWKQTHNTPATDAIAAVYYMVLAENMGQAGDLDAATEAVNYIKDLVAGGNEPWASAGCWWSHGLVATTLTLAKNTPSIWSQLSQAEIAKVDLLMECLAIAANWGYNSGNDYTTGTALDGSFGKKNNPNFLNAYLTCYLSAAMYFDADGDKTGDELDAIFTAFDYDTYISRLTEAGFTNILGAWQTTDYAGTSMKDLMTSGGAVYLPSGAAAGNGVGVKRVFSYDDLNSSKVFNCTQLCEIFISAVKFTYSWEVTSSNGAVGAKEYAYILNGLTSPWEGQMGMMREFSSTSSRSDVLYCYLSAYNIAPLFANMKLLGYWDYSADMEDVMLKMDRRIYVGSEDLFYKMENGYKSYNVRNGVVENKVETRNNCNDRGLAYIESILWNFHFTDRDEIAQ